MKKIFGFVFLFLGLSIFAQKIPKNLKTEFTQAGLQDKVETTSGEIITINQVLNQYKGNIVVLDLWASWCGDCIVSLPKLYELKANNPDVKFAYFSLDKTTDAWKNGIEKYQIIGDHFYIGNNWKNDFPTSIDLNWIPRFIIIDQNGKIAKYYSVKFDDPEVQITLNQLKKK